MDLCTIMQIIEDSSSEFSSELETSSTESEDDSVIFTQKSTIKRTKISNLCESTVDNYTEKEFHNNFRMSRSLANSIIDDISKANIIPTHSYGREKVSTKKAFLLTLWYLANQQTFRQISDKWNVSLSSAYRLLNKVTSYFVRIAPQYIKWPDADKKEQYSEKFRNNKGISDVIGIIDGTHIPIKKPRNCHEVYINRKGFYSILLQAVVNNDKLIMDIHCGEPGSLHSARLLRKSSLYEKAKNDSTIFSNYTLLGDSAYPSLDWLMPPLRDNQNLSEDEKHFNFLHSSARIPVKNAFGLLKGRFRRLNKFENNNIHLITKCVVTACVLHNICLINNQKEIN